MNSVKIDKSINMRMNKQALGHAFITSGLGFQLGREERAAQRESLELCTYRISGLCVGRLDFIGLYPNCIARVESVLFNTVYVSCVEWGPFYESEHQLTEPWLRNLEPYL
jgi:hypothetical protein